MNNNVDTGKSADGSILPFLGGSAGKKFYPDATEFSSTALPLLRGDSESDSSAEDPLAQKTSVAEKLAREILANESLAREILANESLAREILANESRRRHDTTQEIWVDEKMGALDMIGRLAPEETAAEEVASNILPDLVCFSHLRWDFVYQRPQHLMSRSACERRVFFVEEPVFGAPTAKLDISLRDCGVVVVVPHLPDGLSEMDVAATQQSLLVDELFLT